MATTPLQREEGDFLVLANKVTHYLTLVDPKLFQQLTPDELAACLVADTCFVQQVSYDGRNACIADIAQIIVRFLTPVQSVPGGRAFPGITLLSPPAASAPIDPSRHQTPDTTSMDAAAAAEEPVILAAAPTHLKSGKSAGKKPRVNWSMYEVDQLIAEMKIHEEMLQDKSTGIKYRTMSANEKFERIAGRLAKLEPPVFRSASQIEDKWDRLAGDFRKVFDWDQHTPSGKPSYWEMLPDMKKDNRMPPAFSKQLYLR